MGGKIEAYLDCVSPYSYYALLYLQKNRKALASYGVEVVYDSGKIQTIEKLVTDHGIGSILYSCEDDPPFTREDRG